MKNKYLIIILIILVTVVGVFLAFNINDILNENNNSINSLNIISNNSNILNNSNNFNNLNNSNISSIVRTSFALSSEGPYNFNQIINHIQNLEYFNGYDNDTLSWMKTLSNYKIYSCDEGYVIMNSWDANKIPIEFITDAYMLNNIDCDIIENRSLISGENSKDVYLVDNVEFKGSEIHDLGLA